MTNVEKLKELGILSDVRQRLGSDGKEDDQFDEKINTMSHTKLIALHTGWHLGDDSWWYTLKSKFDRLEELEQNNHTEL